MNEEQLLRYSRHILLGDFDYEKQQRLLDAKVLVVGLGGLGCPVAMYLAAAGVGELWLADFDDVELSNLQRQIAHGTEDISRPKVMSANDEVSRLNPDVRVQCISEKLEGDFLTKAVAGVDVVVDASDNFNTRFALNQACVALKKPLVSGAAIRTEGQVIVFDARQAQSPCYRCLYDDNTDDSQLNCSSSGVLAPLVGVIGSMQALETIKVITDYGQSLMGQLLIFDAKYMDWRKLKVNKNPGCPVCG